MKRPNLINPNNWTPFQSMPIMQVSSGLFAPLTVQPTGGTQATVVPLTKKEYIQKNSVLLNFVLVLIMFGVFYFLYSIYLERKIFSDYLEYVQKSNSESNPVFG